MNTVAFDGLVQELGNVSTRRGIFRLLGGVAAVGTGLAVTANDEILAKSRGKASRNRGRGNSHDDVSAQGKGKKITICFQNQTLSAKKKKYQSKYPGATVGSCPVVNGGGTNNGGGGNGGGTQQPVACTNFILSGGPNQTDPISIDDDGSIHHVEAPSSCSLTTMAWLARSTRSSSLARLATRCGCKLRTGVAAVPSRRCGCTAWPPVKEADFHWLQWRELHVYQGAVPRYEPQGRALISARWVALTQRETLTATPEEPSPQPLSREQGEGLFVVSVGRVGKRSQSVLRERRQGGVSIMCLERGPPRTSR